MSLQQTEYVSPASVNDLYERILSQMIELAYKDNKYRRNGISQEDINCLQKKVKSLLKDPEQLFKASNKYQEGSRSSEQIEANIISQDKKDHKQTLREKSRQLNIQLESNECLLEYVQEDEYLNYFVQELKIKKEAQGLKGEQGTIYFVKNDQNLDAEIKHQFKSDQSEDSQSGMEIDYSKFIKCRIVGAYNLNSIRYKSKEDRYYIVFTDVFCKTVQEEKYFQSLSTDMTRTNKQNLKDYYS